MLSKMVCTEEFFRLVAFAEFVDMVEMVGTYFPLWWIWKIFTAVSARVHVVAG